MPRRERAVRDRLTWALEHGVGRRALHASSRRGDLLSRLVTEPALVDDPFGAYEEVRAHGRIVRGRLLSGTVDHALGNQILRSSDFGVAAGQAGLPGPLARLHARVGPTETPGPIDPPSMLAVDPPDHTRFRRLVSKRFTARSVARMEADIAEVATTLLDELIASGHATTDLVEAYASQLPVAVIADLLGVPAAERPRLLDLGNRAAIALDPGLTWRDYRRTRAAVAELHDWFEEHIAEVRRNPRGDDDLLSRLAVLDGDDQLTEVELRSTCLLLLGAGFETTVNLIGNVVVLLDEHPDQRALLRAEPDRWPTAVEEVLRFDAPVQVTLRQSYADQELDGVRFAEGEAVLVLIGGANRDPSVFADPQRFDVTRADADQHLAFSAGVHYCLGAGLARLEAAVALRTLYERFPDLALAGPPRRRTTRILRGFESIPVQLEAPARRPLPTS